MRIILVVTALSLSGALTADLSLSAQSGAGTYQLQKTIQIGGEGGWDYVAADAAGKRLYVSHGTKVVVVDTGTQAVAGEIADTPGAGQLNFVSIRAMCSRTRRDRSRL